MKITIKYEYNPVLDRYYASTITNGYARAFGGATFEEAKEALIRDFKATRNKHRAVEEVEVDEDA